MLDCSRSRLDVLFLLLVVIVVVASVHCLSGSCSVLDCSRSGLDVPFKPTIPAGGQNMGSGHATKYSFDLFLGKLAAVEPSTLSFRLFKKIDCRLFNSVKLTQG